MQLRKLFIKKTLVKLQEAITGNVSDAVVVEEETKKLDKKEEDNKDKEKGEDEE